MFPVGIGEPLASARGYAVFINGGFLVEPHFISQVIDRNGVVVHAEHPARACQSCPERVARNEARRDEVAGFNLGDAPVAETETSEAETSSSDGPVSVALAPRAIDERTAFLIQSVLKDVVKRGTGKAANVLKRKDIGGKTGTTNDYRDAWFTGFGGHIVTSAWVGMDDFSTLGKSEFGARAALPIWIDTMRVALEGVPEAEPETPHGIVSARIDPRSGQLLRDGYGAINEFMKTEDVARLENASHEAQRNVDTERETFDIF